MTLTLDEAVPLAHALVQHRARQAGIRVLSIKGPVLAAQGLRPEQTSTDADLLVDPAGMDLLTARLEDSGWRARPGYSTPSIIPVHSATLTHPGWPCDLDLHWYYPGFLLDPAVAFDELWSRRSSLLLAGVECAVPSPEASMVIMVLHAQRDHHAAARRDGLDRMLRHLAALDTAQRETLLRFARDSGSIEAMRPVLARAGLVPSEVEQPSPQLDDWMLMVRAENIGAVHWMHRLRTAPWRERPRVLWRALVLPEREIRAQYPHAGAGRLALVGAHLKRLGRGLRRLPQTLRGVQGALREDNR